MLLPYNILSQSQLRKFNTTIGTKTIRLKKSCKSLAKSSSWTGTPGRRARFSLSILKCCSTRRRCWFLRLKPAGADRERILLRRRVLGIPRFSMLLLLPLDDGGDDDDNDIVVVSVGVLLLVLSMISMLVTETSLLLLSLIIVTDV